MNTPLSTYVSTASEPPLIFTNQSGENLNDYIALLQEQRWLIACVALLSIAVGAGASGALNMWYDADIDARMARTRARPAARGEVSVAGALAFAGVLATAAFHFTANEVIKDQCGDTPTNNQIEKLAVELHAMYVWWTDGKHGLSNPAGSPKIIGGLRDYRSHLAASTPKPAQPATPRVEMIEWQNLNQS